MIELTILPVKSYYHPNLRCGYCDISDICQNPKLRSRGSDSPAVMVIGMAPGRDEDAEDTSFIGRAGTLMSRLIKEAGVPEEEFRFENIVKCLPLQPKYPYWPDESGKNRFKWQCNSCNQVLGFNYMANAVCKKCRNFLADLRDPNEDEVLNCMPYLIESIERCNPKVLMLTGNFVNYYITDTEEPISRLRGKVFDWQIASRVYKVVPTYHPSYLARGRLDVWDNVVDDIRRAYNLATEGSIAPKFDWKLINDTQGAIDLLEGIRRRYNNKEIPYCVVDFETSSLQQTADHFWLQGINLSDQVGMGYHIPLVHYESEIDLEALIPYVHRFLDEVGVCAHHGKFDTKCSKAVFGRPLKIVADTLLGSYLYFGELRDHGLKSLLSDKFSYPEYEEELDAYENVSWLEIKNRGGDLDKQVRLARLMGCKISKDFLLYEYDDLEQGAGKFVKAPLEVVAKYGALDAEGTNRLNTELLAPHIAEWDLSEPHDFLIEAMDVFADIELDGNTIDLDRLNSLDEGYPKKLKECHNKVRQYEFVKEFESKQNKEFNYNSFKQVKEVLYELAGMPDISGTMSTAETTIVLLMKWCDSTIKWYEEGQRRNPEHPITVPDHEVPDHDLRDCIDLNGGIDVIRVWRGFLSDFRLTKKVRGIISKYLVPIRKYIRPESNLVNINYALAKWTDESGERRGTSSGRFSTYHFSLHTIPWKSDIRRLFVSRWYGKGGLLLFPDYAQLELRVLAALSGDQGLIDAFNSGRDIHTYIASLVFGKPEDEIAEQERRFAKTISFGIVYMRGAESIAADSVLTVQEAKDTIEQYFRTFPKVEESMEKVKEFILKNGHVRFVNKRMRRLPMALSQYHRDQQDAIRAGWNGTIQGPASDLTLKAIILTGREYLSRGMKSRVCGFVHDSIITDIYPGELLNSIEVIVDQMENGVTKDYSWMGEVPLEAGYDMGVRWDAPIELVKREGDTFFVEAKTPHLMEFVEHLGVSHKIKWWVESMKTLDDIEEELILRKSYPGDDGGKEVCKAVIEFQAA